MSIQRDAFISFRLSNQLKERFIEKCDKDFDIDISYMMRQMVLAFVDDRLIIKRPKNSVYK